MTRLVFATGNPGKVSELVELLSDLEIEVVAMSDLGDAPEVEETGTTFEANAILKAQAISKWCGGPALADDSGLEVHCLDDRPGVYSARYAGPGASDQENNQKLLGELEGATDRRARFRSVLALADAAGALGERCLTSQGACAGEILEHPRGTGGFGYDPLFWVPAVGKTFAELGVGTKNDLSHRAQAMRGMRGQLEGYFQLAKSSPSG